MREPPQHTAETAAMLRDARVPRGERYLAIFEPGSSRVVALPSDGELVIGRSADVSLRLDDPSVSRRHAKLLIENGRAVVVDLGSQNGTFVDGEPVEGERALVSGEVIEISQSALVFHDLPTAAARARMLGIAAFRELLRHALDHAGASGQSLSVLAVQCEGAPAHALGPAVERLLEDAERGVRDGERRVLVSAAGLTSDEAHRRAHRLGRALAEVGVACRVGLARSPEDGCEVDAVLASARAAAAAAPDGAVLAARDAVRVVSLGAQTAYVADAAMLRVYALAERLAASDLPVLVHGETGAGKELLALALHHLSPRRGARPIVSLNCAALAESLAESELFGHERGAFTGAVAAKVGLLEAANGGTVFLDEVAELSLVVQAKLLRALDTKRITRVGDTAERPIDVRVVAATHRDLAREAESGAFRSDLFFRLSGATLWLPPLRDRPRELLILARRFLDDACRRAGRPPMRISDEAARTLAGHPFPGNVRELRNVIDFVVAAHDDAVLESWHLEERFAGGAPPAPRAAHVPAAARGAFRPIDEEVGELESARMRAALAAAGGNQRKAAQLIAMPLRTFVTKLARYGLRP